MLELVNLETFADRPVQALSGGQRQRVALARALAIRPRVLLLDEPLTALDALLRHKVREELAVILRRLGITAVIVTHDQDEAMVLGDHIVVMQGGVIHQADTPQNVWDSPATDTRSRVGFIGNSNKLKGRLADGMLEIDGGRIALKDLSATSRDRLQGCTSTAVRAFVRPAAASIVPRGTMQGAQPCLRVPSSCATFTSWELRDRFRGIEESHEACEGAFDGSSRRTLGGGGSRDGDSG